MFIYTFHKRKFDVSLTFAISPITQVYAALLHKKLFGSRAYLWVQDLWPESVSAAGKMNSGLVYRMLTKMVQSIYQKSMGFVYSRKPLVSPYCKKEIISIKLVISLTGLKICSLMIL